MNEKEYWDMRYGRGFDSGYGSYGEQLRKKLDWIVPLDFTTITEVGCGDMNFSSNIMKEHPVESFVGYDISQTILQKNMLRFPQHKYYLIGDHTEFRPADLLMCVDVLFHIFKEEDVEALLTKLEKAWCKYLVITAYERDEPKDNHVRIRKFDPSRFGVPILRQVVEEDGKLYFYIFKK